MEHMEQKYSDYWKSLGCVLIYSRPDFQFKSHVIITELEDCLVKPLSKGKMYNTQNKFDFEVYDKDFISRLKKESQDKSIVVLSNQTNTSKLNKDMIKRKLEFVADVLQIPILCMFALKPNKFMKPHTGLWKLLKVFYAQKGTGNIHHAVVISNEGGLIIEKKTKQGIKQFVGFSDVDRAFASNAGIEYLSIGEYLGYESNPFQWDHHIIPPDVRDKYVSIVAKIKNQNLFKILSEIKGVDTYLIFVMGAPRSGKTRFAKKVVNAWRKSSFGEKNAVIRMGRDIYSRAKRIRHFKKEIDNQISVIIDGECFTNEFREPFMEHIKHKTTIGVLCVEVTVGMAMAKVFNHACVEQADDEKVYLYKRARYAEYGGAKEYPITNDKVKFMTYAPKIEQTKEVMNYRY